MRVLHLTLLLALLTAPVAAQHEDHATTPSPAMPAPGENSEPVEVETSADPHAGHDMGAMQDAAMPIPEAPPPPEAFSGPAHAADAVFSLNVMAPARELVRHEHGNFRTSKLLADQFEWRTSDDGDAYLWDVQGWYGGDINKIWFKSEGEGSYEDSPEEAEVQALWSHAIAPWWDFQAGVRHDFRPDPARSFIVAGLQGLMPYQFEIDAAAFLSDEGDLSARIEAEYDQRITQRLILQPRLEIDMSIDDVPEVGIGSGISSAELGLRLRYEFAREFAPYIGLQYRRNFGNTADYVRASGEDVGGWDLVVGLRIWF